MKQPRTLNLSIKAKILIPLLGISLVSLSLFALVAFRHVKMLADYALESGSALGSSISENSRLALEDLGKKLIRQKAIDVARQIEIYLKSRPSLTVADLRFDRQFRDIAVQPVGATGYTAIVDSEDFVISLHKYAASEGKQLSLLKDKFPSFWAVIEPSRNGNTSCGSYRWEEPDGTVSQKYAFVTPIRASGKNGRQVLTLWATTYMEEFSNPIEAINNIITSEIARTSDHFDRQRAWLMTLLIVCFLGLLFAVTFISYRLSKTITRPIRALNEGVKIVGGGNLDYHLDIRTGDEIEDLANAFNTMTGDLKTHINNLENAALREKRVEAKLKIAETIQTSLKKAISDVVGGTRVDYDFEWMIPHMTGQFLKKGDYLFRKNDKASRMYYLQSGKLRLVELDLIVSQRTIIGETGLLSPMKERTISAMAETDAEIFYIDEDDAIDLFYKNPSLVFELIQISIYRTIQNLTAAISEKERADADLRIAHSIQASMLPCVFPPFPDRRAFDIFASMEPAKEVGGDFYDFFFVDENKFFFAIGDVCGKGVPAALFMAITKTVLKTESLRGTSPRETLCRVNDLIAADNDTDMFATILCGLLDTVTGELELGNAGHNPPLVCRKGKGFDFFKLPPSFVLGCMADMTFTSERLLLAPGDVVFFYTDGVTEAMDPENRPYAENRLQRCLSQLTGPQVTDTIREVRKDVKIFVQSAPQSDDITMLALQYNKDAP